MSLKRVKFSYAWIQNLMQYLVITSKADENPYGDTALTYSFPKQYLRHFEILNQGIRVLAVIYEPRRGKGSLSYVGWAEIVNPPVPDSVNPKWWQVGYVDGIHPFPVKVPRLVDGVALETFLTGELLTAHSRLLQNRSVRPLELSDLLRLFELAGLTSPNAHQADMSVIETPTSFERIRREQTVKALIRDRRFQRSVLNAYSYRCAISGFGYIAPHESSGGRLVEAAHIRPIGAGHKGDDSVGNGISLTPSLHGLFDAGLFSLQYIGDSLIVKVSPMLEQLNLGTRETLSNLALSNGLEVMLPQDSNLKPDPVNLSYHFNNIFKSI